MTHRTLITQMLEALEKENAVASKEAAITAARAYLAAPERCKHDVWAADHCYQCGAEQAKAAMQDVPLVNDGPFNGIADVKLEAVAYIRVSKNGNVMACAESGSFYFLEQGDKLCTLESAQQTVAAERAKVAELEETVRHLNHALRDATEAPTFMGEPVDNELIAPLVRSQYQHKRAQQRIAELEAALRQAVDALEEADYLCSAWSREEVLVRLAITAGKEALQ